MWLQAQKTVSAVTVNVSKDLGSAEDSGQVEYERISEEIFFDSTDLIEEHIFCALLRNFAVFEIPQEAVHEKLKILPKEIIEDSKTSSSGKSYVVKEPSMESVQVVESKRSDDPIKPQVEAPRPLIKVPNSSKRKSRLVKTKAQKKSESEISVASVLVTEAEEIKAEVPFVAVVKEDTFKVNFKHIYDITGENYNVMKYLMQGLTFDFLNGNSYEGNISFSCQSGIGLYHWLDGSKFEGRFADDLPNGEGYMDWADESRYEGYFRNGLRDGSGSYVLRLSPINWIYSGSWSKGLQSGMGTFKFKEENWYEGEFENGLYSGRGMMQYSSGGKYLGEWKSGKQNGNGIMLFPNNDMYVGEWVNGKLDGIGKYVWNTFLNSQFVYPMHNSYMGQWKNGARHGIGNLVLSSGAVISANWFDNKKHGWGILHCTNGTTIESDPLFVNDELVNLKEAIFKDKYTFGSDLIENELSNEQQFDSTLNAKHLKFIDCIFKSERMCASPINIPPYFMNIDKHVRKFFKIENWKERIRRTDWCLWSLEMPPWCESEKVSAVDMDKIDEIKLSTKDQPDKFNKSQGISFEVLRHQDNLNMKNNLSTKVKVKKISNFVTKQIKKKEVSPESQMDENCIRYLTRNNKEMNNQSFNVDFKSISMFKFKSHKDMNVIIQDINESQIKQIYIFEKKWLRTTIIKHMPTLQILYNRYASICCREKPHFEVGLLRILLWKMLQDINVRDIGLSIIEIDEMAVGKTDPFDFVPVCEMIHYLLLVAWELYTKHSKVCKDVPGIVAGGFDLFMSEKIYPLVNKETYEPLFPNSEMVPLEAFYKLFESLGPNVTIKTLVKRLTQRVDRDYEREVVTTLPQPSEYFKHTLKGENGILPGGEIFYVASKFPDFEYIEEAFRKPPEEVTSVDIDFLGTLGVDAIIAVIIKCFPQIINNRCEVVNQNYQICFLEFLEVLSECIEAYLVKLIKDSDDLYSESKFETIDKCLDQMLKEIKLEQSDTKSKKSEINNETNLFKTTKVNE